MLWEKDGSVTDLGTLPGGAGNNVATSINDRGEVVGTALLSDGTVHAFLWTSAERHAGPGPAGRRLCQRRPLLPTINNRGEVVGFSFPGPLGGGRAIVWVDKVPVDLNTLIPAGSPWYLQFASSINDAGEIVGWGTINGEVHAFLARLGNSSRTTVGCAWRARRMSARSGARSRGNARPDGCSRGALPGPPMGSNASDTVRPMTA